MGLFPPWLEAGFGGLVSGPALAALLGYSVFSGFSPEVQAAITAVAAGAILVMLADTMIPEAFEKVHNLTGLLMVTGFMTAYFLSKMERPELPAGPAATVSGARRPAR